MSKIRQKVNELRASEGLKQSLVMVGGNVVGTAFSAVALLLVARMLGPSMFGVFNVGFALIMILNKLNDLGISNATLKLGSRAGNDLTLQKEIYGYATKLKLWLSLIILVLGLLLAWPLSKLLNFGYPSIIFLAVILSFASTAYEQVLSFFQASHRFVLSVIANAAQSGTKFIVFLLFFLLGINQLLPIFSIYMLAPIVAVLLFTNWLRKHVALSSTTLPATIQAQFLTMAKHAAVGVVAAGFVENIDILLVQRYLTTYETGLLGGVSKIAMMFSLIAYSLGNVLYPRVARYVTKEHIQAYFRKALLFSALAVIGFLIFIPFAKLLILLTIGEAYVGGTHILLILGAASFLTIATIPFLALFYTLHAEWYFSFSGIVQLLCIVGGNILFVPEFGLEAAAWVRLGTRLLLLVVTFFVALYLIQRGKYGPQRSD